MREEPGVLFIGGTPRGLRVARLLQERAARLVGVVVMPEDAHEAGGASEELRALADELGVPATTTRRLGPDDIRRLTADLRPDLVLVVGWRTLLPTEMLTAAPLGCVGVHDSPLPRYRGFAPPNWAVLNGEREWGVTLFHLGEGIDDGDVVGQVRFPVAERTTAPQLYDQIIDATVRVIADNLDGLLSGSAPRTPQDHARATYACARTPDDGRIDWTGTTTEVDRLVRALTRPYPGAWTTWKGQRLVVWEAEPVDPAPVYEGRIPGRVVRFDDQTADVLTGDGVLRVRWVAEEVGRASPAGRVLRSVKASLGA